MKARKMSVKKGRSAAEGTAASVSETARASSAREAREARDAAWNELALAAANGAEEAQERLLDAIDDEIRTTVRFLFRGLSDGRSVVGVTPEDFIDDMRIEVIECVAKWKPVGTFRSWLKSVIKNRFNSLLRKARVRQRGGAPETPAESTAEDLALGGDAATIDRRTNRYSVRAVAAQRETRELTQAAIRRLDKRLQRVFALFYVRGLSRAEAAKEMKITVEKFYELERKLREAMKENLPSASRLAIRNLSSGPGEKVRRDTQHR